MRPIAFSAPQRRRVRRVGEVPRAPCPRRRARLDAARRGLPFHADRARSSSAPTASRGCCASGLPAKPTDNDGEPVTHDYLPWTVLLRALSAYEIFRRVSRDRVTPMHVVEFAAFRPDVPRSLLRSAELVFDNLHGRREHAVGRNPAPRRRAAFDAALRHARHARRERRGSLPAGRASRACADLNDRIGRDFLGHIVPT